MRDKIAIVIPTYNRRQFVVEAVASVLRQDDQVAVVVVDDGSQDGTTEELVRLYRLQAQDEASVYKRERLLVNAIVNSERGVARNRGFAKAQDTFGAEWVLFLDADDVLAPGALAHFRRSLKNRNSDLVGLLAHFLPWSGDPAEQPLTQRVLRSFGARDCSGDFLAGKLKGLGALLLKSSAFRACGGFSENRSMSGSEDYDFLCRLSLSGKICGIPHVVTWYRQHLHNTGVVRASQSVDVALESVLSTVRELPVQDVEARLRSVRLYAYLCKFGSLVARQENAQAWALLRQELAWLPWLVLDLRFWRIVASWILRNFLIARRAS